MQNLMGRLKSNKGVTLTVLVITIVVLLILAGALVINTSKVKEVDALKSLYGDIETLGNKVDIYYKQYGMIPTGEKLESVPEIPEEQKNKNDNDVYYVLDTSKLDGLTLKYGQGTKDDGDIFIINQKSHEVYYLKGVTSSTKDNRYYKNPETISKVELDVSNGPEIIVFPESYDFCRTKAITITVRTRNGIKLNPNNEYKYYLSTSDKKQENGEWLTYVSGQTITIGESINGERWLHVKTIETIDGEKSAEIVVEKGEITGNKVEGVKVTGPYNFDNTPPTLDIERSIAELKETGDTNWTKEDITLTINASDEGSGIKYVKVNGTAVELKDGTASYTVTENGTYTIVVEDNAGNIVRESIVVGNIDKIEPTNLIITAVTADGKTYTGEDWTNQKVIVTLKATDNQKIDHYEWYCSANNEEWTSRNITTKDEVGSITFEAERNETVKFRALDAAGNTSAEGEYTIKIDKKAPTAISYEVKNITTMGYDVYVYGIEDNGCGVDRVEFKTWTEKDGQDDVKTFVGTKQEDGSWKYTVKITDHKNEYGTYKTEIYAYDKLENNDLIDTATAEVPAVKVTYDKNYYENNLWTDTTDRTKYGSAGTHPTSKVIVEDLSTHNGELVKFTMPEGTSYGPYYYVTERLDVGKTYTWSVYVKASSPKKIRIGDEQAGIKAVNITTEWQKFTHTFVAGDTTYKNFVFYLNGSTWTVGDELYVHSLEIMEGTPSYIPEERQYASELGTLQTPVREGYTFKGWYTAPTGGTKISSTTTVPESDVTYYAQWEINKHTVTYNYSENGGTSATKTTDTIKYNSNIDLTPTAEKAGCTFVGWNTDKNATTGLATLKMGDANVTLYAIFSRDIIAKFVYYNNQTKEITKTLYNNETSVEITAPGELGTPEGYTFRGWSTSTGANATIELSATGKVTLSAGKTYYASYQTEVTGTFYYCTLASTTGTFSNAAQSSVTAKATKYMNYKGEYVHSDYTIPETVTKSSGGTAAEKYAGVSGEIDSATIVTPSTSDADNKFYAVYTDSLTFYYYNGSAHTSKTVTRRMLSNGTAYNPTLSEAAPVPSAYDGATYLAWSYDANQYNSTYRRTPTATGVTKLYAIYYKSITGTFKYHSATTANVSTTAKQNRHYVSQTSSIKTFNLSFTVPDVVKESWEVYGVTHTYRGVSTAPEGNATVATPTTANTTFYASYSYPITVSYSANGGTGTAPTAATGTGYMNYAGTRTGIEVTMPANPFTKTGYTFAGWNTKTDGTGTNYTAGTKYTLTFNTTLYAKWTENTYTIAFNANAGTGTMSSITGVKYTETVTLPANTFTKTGYTFIGWATSANGSVVYKDKTSVSKLSSENGATVTLYAVFKKDITAKFIYYNNQTKTITKTVYNNTTSAEITAPGELGTPEGYIFRGWSTATGANATIELSATGKVTLSSGKTYYASYQTEVTGTFYYCTLASTTGTFSNAAQSSVTAKATKYMNYKGEYVHSDYTIPETVTKSSGGTAAEKYIGVSGETDSATIVTPSTSDADNKFYAVYTDSLTFYYYNGSAHTSKTVTRRMLSNGTVYNPTLSEAAPDPSSYTKYDGATYLGWSYDPNQYSSSYRRTPTATGVTKLYAIYYKSITGTFKYHSATTANVSTTAKQNRYYVSQTSSIKTFNLSFTVPDVVKESWEVYSVTHTYRGVSTASEGNATVATPTTANTTFYASYSYPITVSYSANGGTGTAPTAATGTGYMNYAGTRTGIEVTMPANPFTKTGYTFAGWNTKADGTGTNYTAGTKYTLTFNTTLYAKWTANTYTIEYYQGNNSSTAGATKLTSSSHTYDAAKTLTAYSGTAPSGWTFYGWGTSTSATSRTYTDSQSVKNLTATNGGTVKLYAIFSRTITVKSGVSGATSATVTQYYNPYITTQVTAITVSVPKAITGWTALGYRDDTGAGGKEYGSATATSITPAYNSGSTMYAVYSRTVHFYSGTNKATDTKATQYYNSYNKYAVKAPAITEISGWSTLGWRNDTKADVKLYDAGATITSSATEYYAVYSRDVHFYSGVNKATDTKVTQYYTSNNTYSVKTPSSATEISNWSTLGWRNDTTAGTKEITLGAATSSSATAYYAVYSRTLTLKYNANGGTGTVDNQTATQYYNSYNSKSTPTFTLQANAFTAPTGYLFSKWAAGSTSGTQYEAETAYTGFSPAVDNTTVTQTMYAIWTPKVIEVTFKKNTSTTDTTSAIQKYTYGVTGQKFSSNGWTRANYVLDGWSTSSTATSRIWTTTNGISDNWINTNYPSITLYAVWKEANYSVTTTAGTYYYLTLQDAIAKADSTGSTITVLKTNSDASTVTVSKSLTINTNGKTVTLTNVITVNSSKTVTFTGSGTITRTAGNLITNNGTVNVSGATLKSIGYTISGGTVTVSSGTVESTAVDGDVQSRGIHASKVTISGGTVKAVTYGIASSTTCNITGGTISSTKYGVFPSGGTLTVTGGSITGITGIAVWGSSTATVNVGNSSSFSTTTPVITGTSSFGIDIDSTTSKFNFYGGVIKAPKTTSVNGVSATFDVEGTVTYKSGYGIKTTSANSIYSTILATTSIPEQTVYVVQGATKNVTITGTNIGTLSISSNPASATATASISGTTLTIKGVAAGDTSLVLTEANGGATAKITIKVTKLSVSPTSKTLDLSGTKTVTVTASGTNIGTVSWKSSNTAVATVSATTGTSITVTGVANGTATITATESNGSATATCTITVQTSPTGVTLNKSTIYLKESATYQLTATISPTTANVSKGLTWESSNTAVATVSTSGVVTEVAQGKATITVKTANGKTATCTVVVDTTAPTLGTVTAQIVSGTQLNVKITGGADTGGSELTQYIVYNSSGKPQGTVSSTAATATVQLTNNTDWYKNNYVVKAVDKAGNLSTEKGISYYIVSDNFDVTGAKDDKALRGLATAVNAGGTFAGRTVKQTTDIAVSSSSSSPWTPIGQNTETATTYNFNGTYDGQNKTISGVYITSTSTYYWARGLFGVVGSSGTVKNITLKSSQINSSNKLQRAGIIVGSSLGTLSGLTVDSTCSITSTNASSSGIGGVAGYSSKAISSCNNSATIKVTNGGYVVGGIVSKTGGSNITISNCNNYGAITCTGQKLIGGIVGYNEGNWTISGCTNSGTIKGTLQTAGIAGNSSYGNVTDCTNSGAVTGTYQVGGISGWSGANGSTTASTTSECTNTGKIIADYDVGGIIGINCSSNEIRKTVNEGEVTSNDANAAGNACVGGIAGRNLGYIYTVNNFGAITSKVGACAGGIAGIHSVDTIENFKNYGKVSGAGLRGTTGEENVAMFGGVVGICVGGTINSGFNLGIVESNSGYYVGGIAGSSRTLNSSTKADATNYAWYFETGSADKEAVIKNCENTSEASVKGAKYVGGIAGKNTNNTTASTDVRAKIFGCKNSGTIYSGNFVGGITGENDAGMVYTCINQGFFKTVTMGGYGATGTYLGGIVGYNRTGKTSSGANIIAYVERCANKEEINKAITYTGGITAYNSAGSYTRYCYNTASITGEAYVGGIVGENQGTISYSYDLGEVNYSREGATGNTSLSGAICAVNSESGTISNAFYKAGLENLSGLGTVKDIPYLKTLPGRYGWGYRQSGSGFFKIDVDGNNSGYPLLTFEAGTEPSANCVYFSATSQYTYTLTTNSITNTGNNIYIYIPATTASTYTITGAQYSSCTYTPGNTTTVTTIFNNATATYTKATTANVPAIIYLSGPGGKISNSSKTFVKIP